MGVLNAHNETTEEWGNRESRDLVSTLQLLTPVSNLARFRISPKVKFYFFIRLKYREEKVIGNFLFAFFLREEHEDVIKQIKKILSYIL